MAWEHEPLLMLHRNAWKHAKCGGGVSLYAKDVSDAPSKQQYNPEAHDVRNKSFNY